MVPLIKITKGLCYLSVYIFYIYIYIYVPWYQFISTYIYYVLSIYIHYVYLHRWFYYQTQGFLQCHDPTNQRCASCPMALQRYQRYAVSLGIWWVFAVQQPGNLREEEKLEKIWKHGAVSNKHEEKWWDILTHCDILQHEYQRFSENRCWEEDHLPVQVLACKNIPIIPLEFQ